MKSSFKWALVTLSIATIVWFAALYVTLQQYREYVEWFDEQYGEWGLRIPYYLWNGGVYVAITGVCLGTAWTVFGFCCLYPSIQRLPHKRPLAILLLLVLFVILMWRFL